jgi:hypothetical protein
MQHLRRDGVPAPENALYCNNSGLIVLPENRKFIKGFLHVLYRLGNGRSSCMMYQNPEEMKKIGSLLPRSVKSRLIPGSASI